MDTLFIFTNSEQYYCKTVFNIFRCYVHPRYIHPFTFFQSWHNYQPAEGRVEAERSQWPGPPPLTTNRLLAEPDGSPWVNFTWVELLRGRFLGEHHQGTVSWHRPHC
jgi:hypothetical protein